ncbi:formate dehydrogenase accessory sulfurtransferase FdhD [Roseospira marina]|uniref:Sulfur carrier protein FdhD n=1 Tax=Roseospira marina TaxID=140057 RepID=A0A5M6IB70_9PROT|nr:formate dehydrogenase accessory sulfurtransferase FdhD [Roseospira marina]KAA5605481.1 formate dehydrogenase accessory sulfurtransferase FdhD [Roseospira marina]MBB4314516.1 FdhD protein [Roseospira marina]MBB5088656.1 FdhD protein [Roseospira marina]
MTHGIRHPTTGDTGDEAGAVDWALPEEAPIAFVYNGAPFAVMMATPADLEDFALGFSLAEGIIPTPNALLLTKVRRVAEGPAEGWELCLAVDPDRAAMERLAGRRALEGRGGCGLCGVETLADALTTLPPVAPISKGVSPAAIARAFAALPEHQPLNARTRSVHGAAFCDPDGRIRLAREDVGRHSALDKLIGAMARAGLSGAEGFGVLSSRCGVELVQKAARVGLPLLATLSAPTTLARETAAAVGMTLAARAKPEGVVLFAPDGQTGD